MIRFLRDSALTMALLTAGVLAGFHWHKRVQAAEPVPVIVCTPWREPRPGTFSRSCSAETLPVAAAATMLPMVSPVTGKRP